MHIASLVLTALVALLHAYFMILEMFLWATPYGQKISGARKNNKKSRRCSLRTKVSTTDFWWRVSCGQCLRAPSFSFRFAYFSRLRRRCRNLRRGHRVPQNLLRSSHSWGFGARLDDRLSKLIASFVHSEEARMPRYEFKEGSSNKFWEITLDGSSFSTKYGKIGADGQETVKEWDDDDQAKKEYDKIIAKKVKEGYKAVGGGGGGAKAAKKEVFEDEGDDEEETPKPKAKAAAKSGGGNGKTRHFEFVEGSSSKFWKISLDGTSFSTKFGRIGTSGQESLKEWDSEDKAKKEYDKLVAEKVKKGYVEK